MYTLKFEEFKIQIIRMASNDYMKQNMIGGEDDQLQPMIFEPHNVLGSQQMDTDDINRQYLYLKKQGLLNLAANNNDDLLMEVINDNGMLKIMNKRSNSKEMLIKAKKQKTTRTSYNHNHFPTIVANSNPPISKVRVSSQGLTSNANNYPPHQRSTHLSMTIDSDDEYNHRLSTKLVGNPSPINNDPFTRVNKFKNIAIAKQNTTNKGSHGIKKQRYSHQEDNGIIMQYQTAATTGNRLTTDSEVNGNFDNFAKNANRVSALDEVSVYDIVNRGKQAIRDQLKPISTKNLNNKQNAGLLPLASAGFEIQKSIGLFRTANQENASAILSNGQTSSRRQGGGPSGKPAPKSQLPHGVGNRSDVLSQEPIEKKQGCDLISINNKASQKSRKISITSIGAQHQPIRETHCQSMVDEVAADFLLSSRNGVGSSQQLSRDGGGGGPNNQGADTSRQCLSQTISRKIGNGGPSGMMMQLWSKLFEARCEDLGLKANEKQMQRFVKGVEKHGQRRKLLLNEMGFAQKSANILSQIIRVGSNIAEWTHIDLSLNKLGTNLVPIVASLKLNTKLVQLRLSNNDLGGNQHIQLLKSLVKEHPSLTDIDLSNDESNSCKNKLGNAGLEAVIEGILDSDVSVISMINIAQNNISSTQPETFNLLRALLLMRTDQIISLNLSDNDLGPDFISTLGHESLSNLKELELSNTRLNNKSMTDLSDYFTHHKFAFLHLNLSCNNITIEGFFKLINALKNNQVLKKLNLSRNDFSFGEEGAIGNHYTIMDQYISNNKSLEELNLNDCKLGPEGASIIGRSLRRNQKLSKLYLSQNRLEDKGLQLLLEGILDNIVTTTQMQGLLFSAPLTDLDVSKNDIQLKENSVNKTLCKILCESQSKVANLSLRDNLIRDEAAEAINLALKQNLSILKFQIDMNPIKLIILKEIDSSVKRNVVIFKEKQAPAIKKEINVLYEERQRVLEDLPLTQHQIYSSSSLLIPRSILETAMQLDKKVKQYEYTNTMCKQQFMEDDRKLDLIREEAGRQEHQLMLEREKVRDERRDRDFEEEQLDLRTGRQERVWAKQLQEQMEKLEIVRLAQSKTIDEREKVGRELLKRREGHALQVEAWQRELGIIMREQSVSQMIQDSYAKEIERVKKNQLAMIAAAEEANKLDINHNNDSGMQLHPPNTAGSGAHRFASKKPSATNNNQRRGNSTLRKLDNNTSTSQQVTDNTQRRGTTTIRQSQHQQTFTTSAVAAAVGANLQSKLQMNIKEQQQQNGGSSPTSRIKELQQMKRDLKKQWKRTEAENKQITTMEIAGGGGALRKMPTTMGLQRGMTNERRLIQQMSQKEHEFRLPNQKNIVLHKTTNVE